MDNYVENLTVLLHYAQGLVLLSLGWSLFVYWKYANDEARRSWWLVAFFKEGFYPEPYRAGIVWRRRVVIGAALVAVISATWLFLLSA